MAELLAGTRAIVLLLEMLPDEIGAKAAARLETAGQAGRPEIAAVDPVLRHRIIIIARPLRHRHRKAHAEDIGDQRQIENADQPPAVVIADLALDAAVESSEEQPTEL